MKKIISLFILCLVGIVNAVELNGIFKDNMVLQRNQQVSIYGTAEPYVTVTVSFNGQGKSTKADSSGSWELKLSPMKKSFISNTLTAKSSDGGKVASIENVLVGDVWLCSGQSNMEYTLGGLPLLKDTIKDINEPAIRGFVIEHREAGKPDEQVVAKDPFKAAWRDMKQPWISSISATAFFFADKLRKDLDVPIGLVISSVGGSQIQRWMPADVVKSLNLDSESTGGAGALYYPMIHPIKDFTIKGVIWYQGESNGRIPDSYYALTQEHIKCWRKIWSQNNPQLADMPFLTVQIAPFDLGVDGLAPDAWAYIRDAQLKTLSLPNTGLAVTTDIGEYADIHPQNKQPVGQRLALWAENMAGLDVEPSGPLFRGAVIIGSKIKINFSHVGSGLETRQVRMSSKRNVRAEDDPDAYIVPANELEGFTICGEDQKFIPAIAKIVDDYVEVSSVKVQKPVAVRYGWSTFPMCNLFNKDGLPASPFRTDNFPVPDVQGRHIGKPWNMVSRNLGSTMSFTGSNPETRWHNNELGGVIGFKPARNQNPPIYAYFRMDDDTFKRGASPDAAISITYFDDNDGTLDVQYDSSDSSVVVVKNSPGAWKSAGKIKLRNTGKWSVVELPVNDAFFGGRCNGADIRINCSDISIILGPVYCR